MVLQLNDQIEQLQQECEEHKTRIEELKKVEASALKEAKTYKYDLKSI